MLLNLLSLLVISLACISWCADGAAVADQCVYHGKTYNVGEHTNTSPCSPCMCEAGGQVMCMAIDCALPNCVNPVRKTGHCCQTCPDGPNCKYHDVTIKAGETYKPNDHTTCQCSTDYMHMFGAHGHEAVCVQTTK